MNRPPIPLELRIFGRADCSNPFECWMWEGASLGHMGYGTIGSSPFTKEVLAHRVAWELRNGKIPKGLQVLHRCDHPKCVNPKHLFLGNNQSNVDDKMLKGRFKPMVGSNHGMSILTERQVLEIRKRYDKGEKQFRIAESFGIDRQRVYQIVHRKQWRHI